MSQQQEVFISVDIETSGPIPGEYSMLSLGACAVDAPDSTFSCLFKPLNKNFLPDALEISGFSLDELERKGMPAQAGMQAFGKWTASICPDNTRPVFVGLNAPFDWSFVNYYFHRFLGANPYGFTALDIKAYYMGVTGCTWHDTRSSAMSKVVHPELQGDHDALHDAIFQAELFRLIRQLQHSRPV